MIAPLAIVTAAGLGAQVVATDGNRVHAHGFEPWWTTLDKIEVREPRNDRRDDGLRVEQLARKREAERAWREYRREQVRRVGERDASSWEQLGLFE